MVDVMKGKQTLKAAELQDGDIICLQRVLDSKASEIDLYVGSSISSCYMLCC
jgi:hypothetical protein